MLDCHFRGNAQQLIKHYEQDKSFKITDSELRRRDESYRCEICNVRCTSQVSLDEHKGGQKHKLNELRSLLRNNRYLYLNIFLMLRICLWLDRLVDTSVIPVRTV